MAHSAELATLSALARTLADAVSSLSTLAHAPAGTVPSSFEPATSLALARTTADALKGSSKHLAAVKQSIHIAIVDVKLHCERCLPGFFYKKMPDRFCKYTNNNMGVLN